MISSLLLRLRFLNLDRVRFMTYHDDERGRGLGLFSVYILEFVTLYIYISLMHYLYLYLYFISAVSAI